MRRYTAMALALAASMTGGCEGAPNATTTTPAPPPAVAARTVTASHPATPIRVKASPSPTGATTVTIPGHTRYGTPLTMPVTGTAPGWLQVQLPTRPNGSSGWVPADAFHPVTATGHITVDLSDRAITVTTLGATLRGRVAVGAPQWPTPTTGATDAYVTDVLRLANTSGTYGAYALGLSLHSDTLTEFGSGDGQIGIHGTSQPDSIGKAVSHGCIRVTPGVAQRLATLTPGTRVTIQP